MRMPNTARASPNAKDLGMPNASFAKGDVGKWQLAFSGPPQKNLGLVSQSGCVRYSRVRIAPQFVGVHLSEPAQARNTPALTSTRGLGFHHLRHTRLQGAERAAKSLFTPFNSCLKMRLRQRKSYKKANNNNDDDDGDGGGDGVRPEGSTQSLWWEPCKCKKGADLLRALLRMQTTFARTLITMLITSHLNAFAGKKREVGFGRRQRQDVQTLTGPAATWGSTWPRRPVRRTSSRSSPRSDRYSRRQKCYFKSRSSRR